jgi:hypothetical protein
MGKTTARRRHHVRDPEAVEDRVQQQRVFGRRDAACRRRAGGGGTQRRWRGSGGGWNARASEDLEPGVPTARTGRSSGRTSRRPGPFDPAGRAPQVPFFRSRTQEDPQAKLLTWRPGAANRGQHRQNTGVAEASEKPVFRGQAVPSYGQIPTARLEARIVGVVSCALAPALL